MALQLPPFKTRNVLVEHLDIKQKQAVAILTVDETRWWGYKKRQVRVAMKCRKITCKELEWSAVFRWDDGYMVSPIGKDSDVLTIATNTLLDMRNMNMSTYDQLLAHRLSIHMKKHHGKTLATSV